MLYAYSHDYSKIPYLIDELSELDCINPSKYDYRDIEFILGLTFDALVMDVTYHLEPDFIGTLVEMVRCKGINSNSRSIYK